MNNHQIRSLTAGVVAALVITALLLLVEKTSLVLAGYFFSLLGIIEFFGTIYYAAGSSKNSWLTNAAFPLAVKNYGIATVLFSVVMAAAQYFHIWSMPTGWFIFIQIIFTVFLIWRLLAMRSGQEEIERVEENVRISTSSWTVLKAEAESILLRTDASSRKHVSAVCDALRYADPMSSPALVSFEEEIWKKLNLLGDLVDAKDNGKIPAICVTIQQLIRERNLKTKVLK